MMNQDEMKQCIEQLCRKAASAAQKIACASADQKNRWLKAMADALDQSEETILAANKLDMEAAEKSGLSPAMLDRLRLTPERVKAMSDGIRHVITLPDPVGHVLSEQTRPNGLLIRKISVPIGVIGIIYESRPNVTVDSTVLCLKAGNPVILRGGSEAIQSNLVLAECIEKAGESAGMPAGAIGVIPVTDRAAVSIMVKMDKYISLVIPRGGEGLIRSVTEQATMPVIKHYKGVCHIFADASSEPEEVCKIVRNAKCQRPSACNALETLLIHKDILNRLAPMLDKELPEVAFHGDAAFCKLVPRAIPATDEDWPKEYLSLDCSVRVVNGLDEALEHISTYSSGHSDSILTADKANAERFLNEVDSATVYVNASTRFTDGGEFGMGAEIGISTDKIHARGPMGLDELTIYKYQIIGSGQIR